MKWLNYHTHSKGCEKLIGDDNVIVVQSLQLGEKAHTRADYATMGLHPLLDSSHQFLQEDKESAKQLLIENIHKSDTPIIAIGECGWDKRSALSESQQTELIKIQIEVAETLQLPMVMHIVAYWHLLLKTTKDHPGLRWIVHGFRGNPMLAKQLLDANIHLSLHPTLIKHSEVLPNTCFIETDDTDEDIRELYRVVAKTRNVPIELLKEEIINYFYALHIL